MDEQISKLVEEVKQIQQRNRRVEADKSWEISWMRRVYIALVTYILAGIWLVLISDTNPWLKAFVPTIGYLLSTLTLSFIKRRWINNQFQKKV